MLSRRPLPRGSETISVSSLEAMQHIGDASSKAALLGVLNVHNLERTDVLLTTSEDTHTTLIMSVALPVAMSTFTVSCTLVLGSGYRMVRPSWVAMYGTLLAPHANFWTRQSL